MAPFPEASVAVTTTKVVPTGKKLFDSRLRETKGACPELSVAVGWFKKTIVPWRPSITTAVTSWGQTNTGGSPSTEGKIERQARIEKRMYMQ